MLRAAPAVPLIVGVVLAFEGDAGVVEVSTGVPIAVLSSWYMIVPQVEWLFAASVGRTKNVVVVLSATATVTENVPAPVAVPEPCSVPPHETVNTSTVELASAVPWIAGLLLFAGEAGDVVRPDGAPGAVESSTYVTLVDEHAETLPAAAGAVALYVGHALCAAVAPTA